MRWERLVPASPYTGQDNPQPLGLEQRPRERALLPEPLSKTTAQSYHGFKWYSSETKVLLVSFQTHCVI